YAPVRPRRRGRLSRIVQSQERPCLSAAWLRGAGQNPGGRLARIRADAARSTLMLSLRLKWLHQSQFAGYYLAEDQGHYRSEGVGVEMWPGGPDVDPEGLVANGGADFAQAGGLESVLAARASGLPIVALGAIFQRIDVAFIAKREAGITALSDFAGRKVSTWH